MKKFLYSLLGFAALFTASCTNDDINIEKRDSVNDVNVTVSLSNFFSSYNYEDTRHGLSAASDYRTFNSEYDLYIQVRTLVYDRNGLLIDSLLNYSTNTNAVTSTLQLPAGGYTIVSTLTFADETSGDDASWWYLVNKDRLSTATLRSRNRQTKWCIMSYDAKQVTVSSNQTTSISMTPQPIGALGYFYLENFWCVNESTYPQISDNGIRSLCLYSQNIANEYKLDPNAVDKYIYVGDAGEHSWWFLSDRLEPTDFNSEWTFFKTNLYDYFYMLAPQAHMIFGYIPEGETSFNGYGEATYSIQSGRTYLAYWDYFQIGNPYFGIADNNHWNTYSSNVKSIVPLNKNLTESPSLHPFQK